MTKVHFIYLLFFIINQTLFAGFYTEKTLPEKIKPQNLKKSLHATYRFRTGIGSNCTFFFISKTGHLLVNIHCIKDCFKNSYGYRPSLKAKFTETESYQSIELPTYQNKNNNYFCERPEIKYGFYNYELDITRPKLVFIGRGQFLVNEQSILKIPTKKLKELTRLQEDFAILKYDISSSRKKIDCISIRKAPLKDNEKIWSIGFPSAVKRNNGDDLGSLALNEKIISYGHVRKKMQDDPALKKILEHHFNEDEIKMAASMARINQVFAYKSLFTADLDGYSGSSGSLVIDKMGRGVGMVYAMLAPNPNAYDHQTTFAVSLPYIRERVVKKIGNKKANQIFDCP